MPTPSLSGIGIDLRQVARTLRASPGFTAVAVLSLAIGIGANTAMYSVIRSLLLDHMAVRSPEELSFVYWHQPGKIAVSSMMSSGHQDEASGLAFRSNYSYPMYDAARRSSPEGVEIAGFNFLMNVAVSWNDDPAGTVGAMLADGRFFQVVGPRFHTGRAITEADDRPGAPVVAVLSHRYWMRTFGGDPAVLNRQIRINGIPADIIGVTAAEYRGISKGGFFPEADITVPLAAVPQLRPQWGDGTPLLSSDRHQWIRLIARRTGLATDGWTTALAGALGPLTRALPGAEDAATTMLLVDASRGLDQTRPEMRRMLYVLMGVVGVVLLIACVNLAGLMLARGVARQREITVRRALGASRGQIARLLLIEGCVLALAGAVAAVALTTLAAGVLSTTLTAGFGTGPLVSVPLTVVLDTRLIGTTLALSLFAALLFSLLPALRLAGRDAGTRLGHQTAGSQRLGRLLVAAQVAITVPLLVGGALLLRTVANLSSVDVGFNPDGLTFFRVDPSAVATTGADRQDLYRRVLAAVADVPGVTSATLLENALLSGLTSNNSITVNGERRSLYMNAVGPDFVATLGMRLLAGRAPGVQDQFGAPPVGMLNESAARMIFGSASPLGQTVQVGSRLVEIIGVVSDARYDSVRADVRPTLYDSALQRIGGYTHVVARSTRTGRDWTADLRQAVAGVSRDLAVPQIQTQADQARASIARERVFAMLLVIFGGFALLLASLGLHGVTSYAVSRRTNEIGLRMALGARPGQILWLIQRQNTMLAVAGLFVGLPLAVWATPLLQATLFGVESSDLTTLGAAAVTLLAVAASAGWGPARRAARLNPLTALRRE